MPLRLPTSQTGKKKWSALRVTNQPPLARTEGGSLESPGTLGQVGHPVALFYEGRASPPDAPAHSAYVF